MNIKLLGIDIAKSIFQLHGINNRCKTVLKKQLRRNELIKFIANVPKCTIAMEACGGANYWAKQFQLLGHEVKLISPQHVKPFVKSNKNDRNDACAIVEAARRVDMHFVPIKSVEQQDIQVVHRIRERLIGQRTALGNQIRGFLVEYGIVIKQGISSLKQALPRLVENEEGQLTLRLQKLVLKLYEELCELNNQIAYYDAEIKELFKTYEACQRLSKIGGVGPITATAAIATLGDGKHFRNGRHCSASLGLVPSQHSSGGKQRLGNISKRGDGYLRKLLIQGARAELVRADKKTDARSQWITQVKARRGVNKATVALANKNARIIWALLSKGEGYHQAA